MRNIFIFVILSSLFSLPLYAHGPTGQQVKDATGTISNVYQGDFNNLIALQEEDRTESASSAQTPKQGSSAAAPSSGTMVVATTSEAGFDPGNPYQAHIKCDEGEKCKIDKFLLKGFRAFSQCQVCHGIDGHGSTIAPSLLEKLEKDITYDIFIDRVTNGFQGQKGVMPPWKTNPNIMKNIDNLYAYLKARSDGVIPAGRLEKFKH